MKNTSTQNQVTITDSKLTNHALYVEATCGTTSALIAIRAERIQVICQNASHKVWRGAGKHFNSVAEAVANYKSPAMKAIIAAADALNH